jgi:hypothetical protein
MSMVSKMRSVLTRQRTTSTMIIVYAYQLSEIVQAEFVTSG